MIIVVKAFDGGFLDRPVHTLNLPIGPGVLYLGQAVIDPVLIADPVKDVMTSIKVAGSIGELDYQMVWMV